MLPKHCPELCKSLKLHLGVKLTSTQINTSFPIQHGILKPCGIFQTLKFDELLNPGHVNLYISSRSIEHPNLMLALLGQKAFHKVKL